MGFFDRRDGREGSRGASRRPACGGRQLFRNLGGKVGGGRGRRGLDLDRSFIPCGILCDLTLCEWSRPLLERTSFGENRTLARGEFGPCQRGLRALFCLPIGSFTDENSRGSLRRRWPGGQLILIGNRGARSRAAAAGPNDKLEESASSE